MLGVSGAVSAEAQVGTRRVDVEWREGRPWVSFDARSMIDEHVRREFQSGLRRSLVYRVYAYSGNGGSPIAIEQLALRVTYDLWDDQYRIQEQSSAARVEVVAADLDAALARCFEIRNVPIGAAQDYRAVQGENVHFAVLAEFNPVSRSTVDRVRRLIARGGQLTDERVIGSFVSLFVNRRIGAADRVLRFRSRLFRVPR